MKKTKQTKKPYQKPVVKTAIPPREIRDLEQPCAFYRPGER